MSVGRIVEKAEALYHDLDFNCVKQWKQETGGHAVGFLPIYVPREILRAAGILPVGIMGGGDNVEIIRGDALYQSYICHLPRSVVELGLAGNLDCLDGFLFPAICDVIRNLSGVWQVMFPGKYVRYMDYPQNFNPEIGGKFYYNDLKAFGAELEQLTGNVIDTEGLNDAIRAYNRNRRTIERLYALRAEAPHQVPAYELYLLMRASNVLEVDAHTQLVEDYIAAAKASDRHPMDNIRVIVTGVFCEQPPLGLIRAIEQAGCYIVDDDWLLGARYLQADVEVGDDPYKAIADGYVFNGTPTASRYIDQDVKGADLIERVERLGAEGVVFASPSFCDPALLERPMLQEALRRRDIPYTSFKYAENSGQFQVIKEQTGAFSDSIKLWGGV